MESIRIFPGTGQIWYDEYAIALDFLAKKTKEETILNEPVSTIYLTGVPVCG